MKRAAILACVLLVACTQSAPVARNAGVYLLLDTSGTYRAELRKAEDVILYTLSQLEPADSFAVARIDTGSFSEKDIIAKTTFDERPSTANMQKRAFAQKVQNFIEQENAAQYTDITGGLLQAVEFLNEKGSGPQDHPHLLGPRGGPRQGLHARHRGSVRRIRCGGAECRETAQGQLRPDGNTWPGSSSGRAGWRRPVGIGAW